MYLRYGIYLVMWGFIKQFLFFIHVYVLVCLKTGQLLILWSSRMNKFKCGVELVGFCIFIDKELFIFGSV